MPATPPRAPAAPLDRYDPRTIALHWTSAILVGVLWLSAQVIDWFPRGPARINMQGVHMTLGVALAMVLCWRIAWRRMGGLRLPAVGSAGFARLAAIVHVVLYLLLAAAVLLGVANAWVRGQSVFNLFSIPSFAPDNRALRRTVGELHELAANTILVVAGLHAASALVHHYWWKDGVLRRMMPARHSAPRT